MDTPQTELSDSRVADDFPSGSLNRVRAGALRLARWLFSPPYFPTELAWLLLALIVSNIAVQLLPQPARYWIDPGTSTYISFLGTPFRWGIWNTIALIGYAVFAASIPGILNIKPGLALWAGLSLYHLVSITESFRCGPIYYFGFETWENCGAIDTAAILLAGLVMGLFLFAVVKMGWIPGTRPPDPASPSNARGAANIRRMSIVWIAVCTLAVTGAVAFSPKPIWQRIEIAEAPMGRTEASLAYDPERSVAVLFGGTSSWTQTGGWKSINDTWEWNGREWAELTPQHKPSPRYGAMMAYDEKRSVTVLFGGMGANDSGQNVFYDDTWEWDGQDWHEVSPVQRPPIRQDAAMFFDPVRGTVVVYGGYYLDPATQTSVFLDDAWEWDGTTWQPLPLNESRRNSSSAVVFDPLRQLPLLMDVEGLWSLQDARWIPLSFSVNPPGRWNSQLVFDPGARQIVLFGGFKDTDVFDDTWINNEQGWEPLVTKVKPPRRNGHSMFYDQTRGRVILFGGLDGGTFYNDMWELVQP